MNLSKQIVVDDLDKYILTFGDKDVILYVGEIPSRLDVNHQVYYIQGLTSDEMVKFRNHTMNTEIPSITISYDMINTSDYENVINTFAVSQIPIKVTGDIWKFNKICKILFELNTINDTNEDIYITSSSVASNGIDHFNCINNQGYVVEKQQDFPILRLSPRSKVFSVYGCSFYLPYCTMFVYSDEIILDDGIELNVHKIIMKSIPYNLIEALQSQGMVMKIEF